MGIFDYLRQNVRDWHDDVSQNVTAKSQDCATAAGDAGEEFTKTILGHRIFSGGGGGVILCNKRVPLHQERKREIDFIIVTSKKVHIVEVKNWSGRIIGKVSDEKWIKEDRSGSRECKNLIQDNFDKVSALTAFFQATGYDIKPEQIEHKVFFVDSVRDDGSTRLVLDKSIENSDFVITTPKLKYFLDVEQLDNCDDVGLAKQLAIRLADLLFEFCLGEEVSGVVTDGLLGRVGKDKHRKMIEDLKRLPTWDHVKLFGGAILRGDIIGHYGSQGKDWKNMLLDPSGVDISTVGKVTNVIVERNCNTVSKKAFSLVRSMVMGNMPLLLHQSLKEELFFGLEKHLEQIPTNLVRGNIDYHLRFRAVGNTKNEVDAAPSSDELQDQISSRPNDLEVAMPNIVEIQYGNRQANLHWLFNNVIPTK